MNNDDSQPPYPAPPGKKWLDQRGSTAQGGSGPNVGWVLVDAVTGQGGRRLRKKRYTRKSISKKKKSLKRRR